MLNEQDLQYALEKQDEPIPLRRQVKGTSTNYKPTQNTIDTTGSGVNTLAKAVKKFAGDPKGQIAFFAGNFKLIAATGRKRQVSNKTQTDFFKVISRGVTELRAEGMPIQNLGDLGQRHIICLLRRWIAAEQGAATITTKLSFFRKFLTLIGKPQIIPRGTAWYALLASKGIDCDFLVRSQVASVSKSWEANGIDIHKVVARVREQCPLTALRIEMQAAFGLRVMESLQIEPEISDLGTQLHVFRGTKGGKARMVQFDEDLQVREWQRDVLERAKVVARKHGKRRLALPKQSLETARNHYYEVIKANGITKAELGVTSHGLRHSFAARKYLQATDSRPPVESPANLLAGDGVSWERDNQARLDISQELGHWRKDVTAAYLGSTTRMTKDARTRINSWIDVFERNPKVRTTLNEGGVTRAWLIGKAAMGMPLIGEEKVSLMVAVQAAGDIPAQVNALTERLNLLVARGVNVSVHFGQGEPDNALALTVDKLQPKDGDCKRHI